MQVTRCTKDKSGGTGGLSVRSQTVTIKNIDADAESRLIEADRKQIRILDREKLEKIL